MEHVVAVRKYQRLVHGNTPIYVDSASPDWFVPTEQADLILRKILGGSDPEETLRSYRKVYGGSLSAGAFQMEMLLRRLSRGRPAPYEGRSDHHRLEKLRECWFHITNRCNMNCRHCMFCSSADIPEEMLPGELLISTIRRAGDIGCRIFYFTGGEPLVYPGFPEVCNEVLGIENAHLVILTNGRALPRFVELLKTLPRDRTHFQLSIDGMESTHEKIRGKGTFPELSRAFDLLRELLLPATPAMTVTEENAAEMGDVVRFAAEHGAQSVHFMWLFRSGRAEGMTVPPVKKLFSHLLEAVEVAERHGITIDNIENLRSQIFTVPGTRFDLSNAGWESLAIGPDGGVYPSSALVDQKALCAGNIEDGLETVWRESSLLQNLRSETSAGIPMVEYPFAPLTGGGDIDHSYISSGSFVGGDPYLPLYEKMALYLISRDVEQLSYAAGSGLRRRMGEFLYECDEKSAAHCFTHSNCVLSLADEGGRGLVKSFYAQAAEQVNEEILNPVTYPESQIDHIPDESRVRSYGCGSPVLDIEPTESETIVDLGSGTGIECFIASRMVGPEGRSIGIDMLDPMLERAEAARVEVAKRLGYNNLEFRKGYLEDLPIESKTVDGVISNCVINLTTDKRRTLLEVFRVLKPGGRLCISDIVLEQDIPVEMKYDTKMRGECLGGAMLEHDLYGMLSDIGFRDVYVNKRFPYREVNGQQFYSLTYTAYRPLETKQVRRLLYRGPLTSVRSEDGTVFPRGEIVESTEPLHGLNAENILVLDSAGIPTNASDQSCCCNFTPPSVENRKPEDGGNTYDTTRHQSGCMLCGAPLFYLESDTLSRCAYCTEEIAANAVCEQGHFVCDNCHGADVHEFIERICLEAQDTETVALFNRARAHPGFPMHGPEHHALIAGIIVAVYRNNGGQVSFDDIRTAVGRGKTVAGGACAFLGVCGAATGVGAAFGVLLKSSPYEGDSRQAVQKVVGAILDEISVRAAARCCRRDCLTSLRIAEQQAVKYLPVPIPFGGDLECTQWPENKECASDMCGFAPDRSE